MKKRFIRLLFLAVLLCGFSDAVMAQKKKPVAKKRTSTKRATATKTKAKVQPTVATVDTIQAVAEAPKPANDSLPIKMVKKSLRPDEAVETTVLRDRTPLAYEHLRADDAVYRHKIWREIDTREKINLPFRYSADENNGNQRFISILLQAIQDSVVTVFSSVDDRFTTPMTKSEVGKVISGDPVDVPIYDENGNLTGTKQMVNDINFDSFYKFRIKEEVIFDKESSRLFWRILGIAPVKNVVTSQGVNLGESELFWVYYPDMRETFAKYEVYNGKNFGARMSWEELFESRMFYGRIIKSTIDNPYDQFIKNYKGLNENGILQLLEGENIKDKVFNYEQDLWSY
ncbi:MAG TPA: gliding motility protein GldN [Ferruginibacter sp.]|nr:gliding motility protein GldN [Ferruginibacter sp.]